MKNIILKRRKQLGLTQQELADKLFVSNKVISKWETGKSVPDTSMLVELSKVLNISLDNEETDKNIKLAINDHVNIKYTNIVIMTFALAGIACLLFCFTRYFDRNSHHIIFKLLYVISVIVLIVSVVYFVLLRNKISMDYPRFKEIEKFKIKTVIIGYGLIVFTCTATIVFTHGLTSFEELITLLIAGVIESIFFILLNLLLLIIHYLYFYLDFLNPLIF